MVVTTVTFLPIESRPFVTLDRELVEIPGVGVAVSEPCGDVADAFVKIRIRTTDELARRADIGQIRADLLTIGAHTVWIEVDVERAVRARVEGMDETVSDVDALEAWLESQSVNGDQAPAIRSLHADYLAEVGAR